MLGREHRFPGCGKTAPGKGTKSRLSVLKAFSYGNSVLHCSISRTRRGFAFLARMGLRFGVIGFAVVMTP